MHSSCRSIVVLGLSLILIMISGFAAAEQRPNVLLIVADDMGWNDLSITGNPTISTPNLERLAERGSLFTQFSVAAPICTPSRAAMLTGRLPIRTGVYADEPFPIDNLFRVFYPSSVNCLPEEEVTIGDALKAGANYSTAMIGKWHLGHNPEKNCLPGNGKQGFDFFYGLPYSHEEGYPGPFPEGFVFPPVPLLCDDKYVEQPYNGSDLTSRYTSLAIDMLDRFAAGSGSEAGGAGLRGRGRGERAGPKLHDNEHVRSRLDGKTRRLDYSKPFFLHVAYENPHVPLFVSDKYAAEHEPSRRGLYGDAVQEMDASIGEILDALDETGLADNTIIMFMSDNGAWVDPSNGLSDRPVQGMSSFDGGSNAPFYEGKGSTWEGGFRVPLIVAMPPSQPKQPRFIRAPTMGIDLFPTILDYAGVPTPEGVAIDGVSLRSILQSASAEDPHDCLYYWRENELYAIRCGSYKAHFKTRSGFNTSDPGTEHHPPLLFQLEWDPAERLPLPAADYASVLAGLTAAADAHVAEIERVRPPSLYLAQNLTLMPCCPRGSNQGIVVGDVPDHWSDCVCTRLIENKPTKGTKPTEIIRLDHQSPSVLMRTQQLHEQEYEENVDPPVVRQIARSQVGSSFVRDSVGVVGPSVVRIDAERDIPQMLGLFADEGTIKVSGSGFVVSQDGYILTNAHVVEGTKRITVSLANGRTYKAELVSFDELTDLALLKASTARDPMPVAPMGDSSKLQSGDWVIAVGCPVGLDFTVTLGIVSNPKRSAFEVGAPHMKGVFIQTDAALNQGNSGGPLVDEEGKVVGINTMVRTNTEAIGFAIPINRAQQIYQVLRSGQKPSHAYFGLEAMTTSPDYARIHNDDPNVQRLPPVHGALVMRVVPGSPAATAGLRKNDIVRAVGGEVVRSAEEADTLLDACTPGAIAKIRVARGEGGREVELMAQPLNLLTVIEERRQRSPANAQPRPTPQQSPGRPNGRGGRGR